MTEWANELIFNALDAVTVVVNTQTINCDCWKGQDSTFKDTCIICVEPDAVLIVFFYFFYPIM